MLDVDDLEELSEDEFDLAEPSMQASFVDDEVIPSTRERRRRVSEIPVPSLEDDELIPVVVEQDRSAEVATSDGGGVEDRFGFDDEGAAPAVEDRFGGFDEGAAAIAPTDSESHAIDEGVAAIARAIP